MKPYIGIGTIIKDHFGHTGKIIGYDEQNKIVTIRYADQKVTRTRPVNEVMPMLANVFYREAE